MWRKVVAVGGFIVVPWLVLWGLLGLISGDWVFAFWAWPGAIVMASLIYGTMFGVFKLFDWAFD